MKVVQEQQETFEANGFTLFYVIFPFLCQFDGSSKRGHIKSKEVMDIDYGKTFLNDDRTAPNSNQSEYVSSRAAHLRPHLKTHSGEK